MEIINGCTTLNDGIIRQFTDSRHSYYVELLGPGFSTHLENIAVTYFLENEKKIGMGLWYDKNNGEAKIYIDYCKNAATLDVYYSKAYNLFKLPKKYALYAGELLRAYSIAFNNGKMAFDYPKEWGMV